MRKIRKYTPLCALFLNVMAQPVTTFANTQVVPPQSAQSEMNSSAHTLATPAAADATTSSLTYTLSFNKINSSYQILTVNVGYSDGSIISSSGQPITSTATATPTDDYAELDISARANMIFNNSYRSDVEWQQFF
ncbi:hypothetical protein HA909_002250 [Enterococcus faecalis]|nr:hypothetical protein [Enterococcus faecalis]